jgi:4-amino-4-deoxy-L-arabinose transferase-like glycosyltransferase
METKPTKHSFRFSFPLIAFSIILAWIFPGLLGHEPWKPDEGYTFGLILSILDTGDWVVPTLAEEPFIEKPPIYFLTAAFLAKLLSAFLPLHDGARLASGLYMAITFLFTGLASRELYGKETTWVAPLLLLGCLGLAVRMHQIITDVALLTGFAVAFYGLAVASRRNLWGGFWLGTGTGLCFLSKGLLGLGIIGIAALALPIVHVYWRNRAYFTTLTMALVAVLPWLFIWPVALYIRSPELFYEWLWTNNFGKFFGSVKLGPKKGSGFYFKTLLWFSLPVWPLAVFSLARQPGRHLKNPTFLLPVIYLVTTLSVLGIASDTRELYAIPLLLPLAILAVPGCMRLNNLGVKMLGRSGIVLFGLAATILWVVWVVSIFKEPELLYQQIATLWLGINFEYSLILAAIALTACFCWLWIIRWNTDDPRLAIINWSAGAALIWLMIMTLFLPTMDRLKNFQVVFKDLKVHLPENLDCVSSLYLGAAQRAMLQYYVNLITYQELVPGRRRNCSFMLIQYRGKAYDYLKAEYPGWHSIWRGRRPGDEKEFYILYERNAKNLLSIPVE